MTDKLIDEKTLKGLKALMPDMLRHSKEGRAAMILAATAESQTEALREIGSAFNRIADVLERMDERTASQGQIVKAGASKLPPQVSKK